MDNHLMIDFGEFLTKQSLMWLFGVILILPFMVGILMEHPVWFCFYLAYPPGFYFLGKYLKNLKT